MLATKLFPLLDASVITSQRLPADDSFSYDTIRGMSVITADMDLLRNQLQNSLFPEPESAS